MSEGMRQKHAPEGALNSLLRTTDVPIDGLMMLLDWD